MTLYCCWSHVSAPPSCCIRSGHPTVKATTSCVVLTIYNGQYCAEFVTYSWLMTSGSKPACQFVMKVSELGRFHRLPRPPVWHRLLEPASFRTSFLVGGQVRSVFLTSTSVWPVDSIQICQRARPLADRRNGTRCQCKKNTVICLHVTQSRVIEHDCSQLHLTTVATGCMPCLCKIPQQQWRAEL